MKESVWAVLIIVKISVKMHSYLQPLPITTHSLIYLLGHILIIFSSKSYFKQFCIITLLIYNYLRKLPLNCCHHLIKQFQGDFDENYCLLAFKVKAILFIFLFIPFTTSSLVFRMKSFTNFNYHHSHIQSH